jgi:hypothetical protein
LHSPPADVLIRHAPILGNITKKHILVR